MNETSGEEPAFLGVEKSCSGRFWYQRGGNDRLGLAISQRLDLPEIVGRLIAARGVDLEEAERWLVPTLREFLPNPSSFLDMDKACTRLAEAVRSGERIAIFGDYDVDGATSSALLSRFLHAAGNQPVLYIPDRLKEGYGPNAPALRKLAGEGVRVVVTVDCGATAHEPLQAARDAGLDVIVCDHHVGEPALPPAWAVVNPNRFDETAGHRDLAAVGVAFLLAVGTNRALRLSGWYSPARPEPDLLQLLDLVAVGTVCDVVKLVGANRALVTQGLRVLAQRQNVGLRALADIAGLNERPEAYHLGYILGPRINAGGRVGQADLGARLLSTDDPAEAQLLAVELHRYNDERREIEAGVLEDAITRVEARDGGLRGTVFVAGEGWHPGVIGIVASRLKDRYNRPTLVAAIDDAGIAKGSGRSIPGFALGDAVIAARQAGLLINGGGHAMAAGFTTTADRLGDLEDFLEDRVRQILGGAAIVPRLGFDGALDCQGVTPELVELLAKLGPYGAGNSEPRFVVPGARVVQADIVGTNHVRVILTGSNGGRLKGIAFRAAETPLGEALLARGGVPLHVGGTIRMETWQGRVGAQMFIDDAASALT